MEAVSDTAVDRGLKCPGCGHELSKFRFEEADRGERIASKITDRVATWWFPTAILVGVLAWGITNVVVQPFEPYPVIVLAWISAVLATVAACQGPLILLAQRRAAMHDRERDIELFRIAMNSEADLHTLQDQMGAMSSRLDELLSADSGED